jgi:hypothetical protein
MNKILLITCASVLLKAMSACHPAGMPAATQPPAATATVTIHWNIEKQTIHSFGASDCWTAKFIGNWTDVQKKNQVADYLFSMDTLEDGSPKGIGLSLWRFNIGAGSWEQGAASGIPDEWRREECFLDAAGVYDFNRQQGQQWFLQAARQRGVPYTLGFSIAPPVFWSKNGKAWNGTGTTGMNIRPEKMEDYAAFMAKVSQHFQFDYLSPFNEPQWFWGKDHVSQEGTQATNDEMALLARLLSQKLSAMQAKTKVVIGEAGTWTYLYGDNHDNRGDQVAQFFSPASSNYIGNLPNVARTISGHSYFTTCPDDTMVNVRRRVAARVQAIDPSLETWQTEFGILGNICNQYTGAPRNTGISYGLYVASVIHHDLTEANVSSWQWWLAMSPYNYSDALVYINDPSGAINVNGCKEDGKVLDSRQLWVMGNYSRFIRPGMKRVEVSVKTAKEDASLLVSAYKDESSRQLVMVIVNPVNRSVQLSGKNWNIAGTQVNAYTTNANSNLKKSVIHKSNIQIPPVSVVTLTASYQ